MAKNLKFLKSLLYALMCIILFILPLQSQTNGKIAGKVFDAASDEPLAGVNVIVKGTFLGSASDADGYFTILNVPPSTYEVEASMVGYKTIIKTDVLVSLERTTAIDFELEEATLEGETVVVVAERDILHKEVSSAQQVITPLQIERAAGVNTLNDFIGAQAGIQDARLLTIRGGSAEQTGILVDGLSFVNQRIGKAEATIPISAVEQVSLNAGGYSAEYGNFRSGIINMTTKAGDKDTYHASFRYSRSIPDVKRFGQSWYDPDNRYLKVYFDPVLAFEGTERDQWMKLTGDSAEAEYQKQNYQSWRGWNDLTELYNRNLPVEQQASAMDLYLWNAWMHMIVPDFEKLEELYPQYEITEEQKQALRDHAHKKEGKDADWDLDFGFGGPLPFVSNALGDATFYLSHKSTNFNYVQPVTMRESEKTNVTLLTLKSNISRDLTVKWHGLYRLIQGTQSNFPSDGDIPSLDLGGDTMPINNLETILSYNPNAGGNTYGGGIDQYAYHATFWQPKDQKVWLSGLTVNQIINENTFLDLTMSYAYQKDLFEPKVTRDRTPIINFGPIWVDEMPYGITFAPDTIYYSDTLFVPGEYENAYSVPRRFASKVGEFHENSVTQQFKFKLDLSNQYNRYNFFKTGVELNYFDIDNNNWRWWYGHDTIYELRDRRKPYQLGGYIQDQISLNDMEARIGVRFDYYNSGGGVWPTGDPYSYDAFSAGTEANNINQLYEDLSSGKSVIWDRWHAIDDSLGGTFLEKTKNYFTVSPRIGVSFPVTERAKFFFNYGHYRQPLPYSTMFMYKQRFYKQGLFELGNPNIEPARTISYELGAAYNLLDEYLVEFSTFYKDVSGESATLDRSSESINYDTYLSNHWEDNFGLELRIDKRLGTYFTGWFNFWYVIDKNGDVGSSQISYDPSLDQTETSLYVDQQNTPTIQPKIAANISLHTPDKFGPETSGLYPAGSWTLSLLPVWERGAKFTFNPLNERNVQNNLQWPDYYKMDLKLSKTFKIFKVNTSFYVDIRNVFNTKISWLRYRYAFSSADDYEKYLKSLHLSEYKDRRVFPDETTYIAGNDKVGDFRSKDKPYINDPDFKDMFAYGEYRQIWFGIKFDF